MTVAELIDQAFVDLAVIAPGDGITALMLTQGFSMLNMMWGNWSAERVMAYLAQHGNFTPVAGTSTYTLGTGGTFTTSARPVRVTAWSSSVGNFSNGGAIMGFDEFRAKTLNATARRSQLPELVAADQEYPSINIELFPTPDTTPGTLRLDYWIPLVQFSSTGQTLTLPDEYFAALHFNLAVALAPQYARQGGITPELAANAQNTKAAIMQKNAEIIGLAAQQQAAA